MTTYLEFIDDEKTYDVEIVAILNGADPECGIMSDFWEMDDFTIRDPDGKEIKQLEGHSYDRLMTAIDKHLEKLEVEVDDA